jgi:hypothetical protein
MLTSTQKNDVFDGGVTSTTREQSGRREGLLPFSQLDRIKQVAEPNLKFSFRARLVKARLSAVSATEEKAVGTSILFSEFHG